MNGTRIYCEAAVIRIGVIEMYKNCNHGIIFVGKIMVVLRNPNAGLHYRKKLPQRYPHRIPHLKAKQIKKREHLQRFSLA